MSKNDIGLSFKKIGFGDHCWDPYFEFTHHTLS